MNQTLDAQDSASIQSAVEIGLATFGRIDALVNNAGYGAYGPLEATPLDNIRRQFDGVPGRRRCRRDIRVVDELMESSKGGRDDRSQVRDDRRII